MTISKKRMDSVISGAVHRTKIGHFLPGYVNINGLEPRLPMAINEECRKPWVTIGQK